MSYRVECFYCSETHSSDFWDEVETALEACRQQASARKRVELGEWVDDTIPIRCEAGIPPDIMVMEQERAA